MPPYLRIVAIWDTNEFKPYINGNHHWFRVTLKGYFFNGTTEVEVYFTDLWDARVSGHNNDPYPPDGLSFGKCSTNEVHNWFLVHNKYTLYGAVIHSGIWYTAKVEIDLDAVPPVIQQFGKSPIVEQASGSVVYIKAKPNSVVRMFNHNQTSDSYAITSPVAGFTANGRNYNRYTLSRQFSKDHIRQSIANSSGIASFFSIPDGRYVFSSIDQDRSESFMMNEISITGGSLSASVRQIWLEYTNTGDTRVNSTTGKKQRRYTMAAKFIFVNNASNVLNVPLVSGVSPIKISTSNNGDYVSISSHDGWFNEGLLGLYINDSIADTPDGNSEPGTYWTDSFIVPNVGASSIEYNTFTSLADAVARKNTILRHSRLVYCNGPFNKGNKVWQNGTIGNCDQTPNGIYNTDLYSKAYIVVDGVITDNTFETPVDVDPEEPPVDNGNPSARWGGVRTSSDRGLIKDNRFTTAQNQLANNGSIINTNVDIDVLKLTQGFLHDNNWFNLKGWAYKRWKIDQEDFRSTPLRDVPIPTEFTGFTYSLTIYYFNSSGIIKEQFQEHLQL